MIAYAHYADTSSADDNFGIQQTPIVFVVCLELRFKFYNFCDLF